MGGRRGEERAADLESGGGRFRVGLSPAPARAPAPPLASQPMPAAVRACSARLARGIVESARAPQATGLAPPILSRGRLRVPAACGPWSPARTPRALQPPHCSQPASTPPNPPPISLTLVARVLEHDRRPDRAVGARVDDEHAQGAVEALPRPVQGGRHGCGGWNWGGARGGGAKWRRRQAGRRFFLSLVGSSVRGALRCPTLSPTKPPLPPA